MWDRALAGVRHRDPAGAPTRRRSGHPLARPWLASALHLAVRGRDWPGEQAAQALRHVAADSKRVSPMRVAEAGPWWDEQPTAEPDKELREMEEALLESGGARIQLQIQARNNLRAARLPIIRAAVTRAAFDLLTQATDDSGAA